MSSAIVNTPPPHHLLMATNQHTGDKQMALTPAQTAALIAAGIIKPPGQN